MSLITLTSDIGRKDYLPGAIKGTLLQIDPQFRLIDITHDLAPFNYPQTAYITRNAIRNFPGGTFHLILVNLFDKKKNHLLLVKHDNQYIGIADNGLITMILEEPPQEVVALPLLPSIPKNTLYFSRVFGNAIHEINQGKSLSDVGDPSVSIEVKNPVRPMHGPKYIEGQIIFIDHFENVIVNITREEFEEQRRGRGFKIVFMRDEIIDRIHETYADVSESEKIAIFNGAGYLEIAINKGNAAGLFGLQGYTESGSNVRNPFIQNQLLYQTVKIFFD